ncbi:CRISPR-associated helicase Cas3' [Athalassotoga saccharophila]|uniref:CRISPR-associated helicase Cas3' n=1 Tax=Athalassotoga saccharophila TaxID=1441386 RepID=UPI001E406EC2|nr:CRISPR-associated helicase Cas3' [Athalassotoga saccharophila]
MLYSHPQRPLVDHLLGVEKIMLDFFEDQKLDTQKAFGIETELFKSLIHVIAISHDLGKATKKFQEKLTGSNVKSPHSEISAIYAYAAAKECFSKADEKAKEISFYAFVVVRRHHGFLKYYIDEVAELKYSEERLVNVTKSIDKEFATWFKDQTHVEISPQKTAEIIDEISEIDTEIDDVLNSKNDLSSYFAINFLYSILIDADRLDAATYGRKFSKRIDFDTKVVQKYMESHFKNSEGIINDLREAVHKDVLNSEISLQDHFYTITVPTGIGKTLTSFDFALKLREMVKDSEGRIPKIIYALPFTSLVDQNAQRIKDVLSIDREVSTDLLLVQHHLAPNEYTDDEVGPLDEDLSSLLISGWDSEIIVTTFVSLFEGLISNRRSDIRKLHTIFGAIVILDEIQNIPHEYWKLISEVFNFIAKNTGTYFILTTATKPKIFIDSKELAKDKFMLKRIKIVNETKNLNTLESLYEMVDDDLKKDKRVLVVLNTISSSQNFFKMFEGAKIKRCYLSAGVIPKLREKVINEINKGDVKLLVSTQVVEAGMDIDFDTVYRDMAPVDSIIQSCGRCNRNYTIDMGIVHLIDLKNDNGTSYSNLVYDDLLVGISREIFNEISEITEEKFEESLINPYFERVSNYIAQSEKYLNALKMLFYFSQNKAIENPPISTFSIIKGFLNANIYIEYDEKAVELRNEFEEIQSLDPKEWYVKAISLFKKMNQYMISINLTKSLMENGPPILDRKMGNSFYLVQKDRLNDFYDEEIGFKIPQKDVMIM